MTPTKPLSDWLAVLYAEPAYLAIPFTSEVAQADAARGVTYGFHELAGILADLFNAAKVPEPLDLPKDLDRDTMKADGVNPDHP